MMQKRHWNEEEDEKTRSACNARPTLMLNLSLAFIKEKTIIQFENTSFVFSPFKLIKSQTILERKETNSSFSGERRKNKGKEWLCSVWEGGRERERKKEKRTPTTNHCTF